MVDNISENILFSRSENNFKVLGLISGAILALSIVFLFLGMYQFLIVAVFFIPFCFFLFGEKKETEINMEDKKILIRYAFFKKRKKHIIERTFDDLDSVSLYKFIDNRTAVVTGDNGDGQKIVNYYESLITKQNEEILLNVYTPIQWAANSVELRKKAQQRSENLNLVLKDTTKDEKKANTGQMRNMSFMDEEKKSWQEKMEGMIAERKVLTNYKLL